jgi:O-antigen/teichoic acid export membrane protein
MHYLPDTVRRAKAGYRTKEWLVNAVPFTLIGGAGIINNQVDILMLGHFRSPEDVGIYRVAVQGSALVAFGLQAVTAVVIPQFARLYAQGDMVRLQRLVTISARVVFITALPVVLIFFAAGGAIASFVFGSEFVASHYPLAILAFGQLVNTLFGPVGALLQMVGHENITARMIILTALLNIPLNAVLIYFYGPSGAAMATAICVGLLHLLLFFVVRSRLGLRALPI